MATALALKRFVSSNLLTKSLRPVAAIADHSASSRLFNAKAFHGYNDGYLSSDDDRRSDQYGASRRHFSASSVYVIDPLSPSFLGAKFEGCRGWGITETEDFLHLRIDMPGLGKEDVQVSAEDNILIMEGGLEKGSGGEVEESQSKYGAGIKLPEKLYKTEEIKAVMKDGVLNVMVPKVKDEERTGVIHIRVE